VRRVVGDALISMAAPIVLLTVLVAIDTRVRDHVVGMVRDDRWSSDVASMNAELRNVASVIAITAREQSLDNAPLVVFAVAGTALVLAMLRL
jgi:hypothetical protein